MSNVIIPPEHQSAPNDPLRRFTVNDRRRVRLDAPAANNDDVDANGLRFNSRRVSDAEEWAAPAPTGRTPEQARQQIEAAAASGNPVLADPKMRAALLEFEKRRMDKSPPEMIERLQQEYERNYADQRTKAQRWHGQGRWLGPDAFAVRFRNFMSSYDFIRRLRYAGVAAGFENRCVDDLVWTNISAYGDYNGEITGNGGPRIWLNRYVRMGRIGVTAWVKPERGTRAWEQGLYVAKTVTTVQYGQMPEWSILRFDKYDVPQNERYRGWRTALVALLLRGLVTEAQAERGFGRAEGEVALFYREQLWRRRAVMAEQRDEQSEKTE